MKTRLGKPTRTRAGEFLKNQDGHFAVWFAAIAFPLLVGTTAAIDFRKAEYQKASIKGALDSAVLAAVSNNSISNTEKQALATKVFNENYSGGLPLELMVDASRTEVAMTARGEVPTSIGRAVGMTNFKVAERSVATMDKHTTICVLALAKSGAERIKFADKMEFDSPNCAVQSNSKHARGMVSTSKHKPGARMFCSAGGAVGDFRPSVRGECEAVNDPYAVKSIPKPGACMPEHLFQITPADASVHPLNDLIMRLDLEGVHDTVKLRAFKRDLPVLMTQPVQHALRLEELHTTHSHAHCHTTGSGDCHTHEHYLEMPHHNPELQNLSMTAFTEDMNNLERILNRYEKSRLEVDESHNFSGNKTTLRPGTYCGGLNVNAENITFQPGVYIIKDGMLTFKNKTVARADGVTFVFHGYLSGFRVEEGAKVYIKAPSTGPTAGFALMQDRRSYRASPIDRLPDGVNLVSSGGQLDIVGTVYTPTQAVDVSGDSRLGANSDATAFISYQVTFAGETKANVKTDHRTEGLPPMKPLADDSARLIE